MGDVIIATNIVVICIVGLWMLTEAIREASKEESQLRSASYVCMLKFCERVFT